MNMMTSKKIIISALLLLLGIEVAAQQYNEGSGYYDQQDNYSQDNLYHDYAARQQDKADGVAA